MQMKNILLVLILASSIVNAGDVKKTTFTKTKGKRTVTIDTYTRNSATNLVVRKIFRKDENKTYTIQKVYHNGKIALEIWNMNDGLTCSAHSISGVQVGTHFTPSGVLEHVNLMTTNLVTLDHFTVTNGILFPVSSVAIKKSNAINRDVKNLFIDFKIGKTDKEQFLKRAKGIVTKYKNNESITNRCTLQNAGAF